MKNPRIRAAKRTADIQPFAVMDVLARAHALAAAGRRVIHIEIGEPDFTAPAPVVEAAVRALKDGASAYTPALGLGRLREEISRFYSEKFLQEVQPERVVVTSGASGGLLLVLALYVDPGDEVLVPDPGYPGYRHMVRAFEGRARALKVSGVSNFQPTLDMVRAAWGRRTRGLLLGSPSNPTGTLISRTELEKIARFIASRGGVLIVDEIYQGLVYGQSPACALGLPGEVAIVNSFSKYFCMTGWRLGWVVLPASRNNARVRELEKLAQHLFICAPTIAQRAGLACFLPSTLKIYEERRVEFQRRRDLLLPRLERAGLAVPARPEGAFYIYADCAATGMSGRRFALELLEREGVAATPGVDFGSNNTDRFVRFAYTRALGDLEEAARRIEEFCRNKGGRMPPRSAARSRASEASGPAGGRRPARGARARRAP